MSQVNIMGTSGEIIEQMYVGCSVNDYLSFTLNILGVFFDHISNKNNACQQFSGGWRL